MALIYNRKPNRNLHHHAYNLPGPGFIPFVLGIGSDFSQGSCRIRRRFRPQVPRHLPAPSDSQLLVTWRCYANHAQGEGTQLVA